MMFRKRRMAVVKTLFILTAVSVVQFLSSVDSYELGSRRSESLHRFKSLDRIRNRLEGNSAPEVTNPKDSETIFSALPAAYTNSSNAISSNALGTGGSSPRGTTRLDNVKDVSDIESDELDDDDEDSYEDEEDEELLADKTPSWNGYSYSSNRQSYRQKVPITNYQHHQHMTTTTTTTTTTTPPPISYSQYKWQHLGTRQGVEQYRRNSIGSGSTSTNNQRHHNHHHHHNGNNHHPNNRAQPVAPDTSIREAINHAVKVSKEGSCGVPKPRLVRVQDFYPHPGKTYVPHCTILHQCSDDTGCCRHEVLTCSPKTTQRVELAFYTITVDSSRGSTVERLVFYNHTECECRDRMEDLMPRDVSAAVSHSTGTSTSSQGNNGISLDPLTAHQYQTGNQKHKKPQCKCSSAYAERVLPDGSCSCDCFDKQKECLRLKRGKDFFSMQDKWCIQTGRCEVPECAYGTYIHLAGRCPRKKERFSPPLSWHRYLSQ